jgi:NAD(P)-dependent dehydrogenase (short-subunit alcohol dehydrogenase family)
MRVTGGNKTMDVAGKTAFITGAASGIGFGIAKALARAGAKVMLADIEAGALTRAVEALKLEQRDIDAVKADVSIKADLQRAAEATLARFGAVDILVNNAGVIGGGPYGSWSDEVWDWVLGVNLRGVIWGVEIFGPLVEKARGHIVNTVSTTGLVSRSSGPYPVTKYAVLALTEGLRRELAPKGVGVSALCPGFVKTGIAEARRNLPERFDASVQDAIAAFDATPSSQRLRAGVARGLDPDEIGEITLEGIRGDWPYIFSDTAWQADIEARFEAVREGFERVRAKRG